jgi:dihydrofolate synthase/folylpolyglutamate synthase
MGAYEDTLAWLSALEVSAGWDLKLDRMARALAVRGHPESRWPALHIAGTNGKGSVAAMLDAVLRAAGHRTGLYTSPHLVDFTERIRADGRTIPQDAVVALVAELRPSLESAGIALTHFEFATLIAFEWFARIGVEAAVVEVGLGGRLDATNLVRPAVTAITSIARDHEEYLGTDLRSIAAEKAGIAKPGIPLVVGRVPREADEVIAAHAATVGAPLARVEEARLAGAADGLVFRGGGLVWDRLRLALPGSFQRDNAAVALLALAQVQTLLRCPPQAVRDGLATVRWPGRLEVVGRDPLVILDGAHNPAGTAALARELPALLGGRRVVLVFAVMADKDWCAMLAPLWPYVARAVVTRVGRRAADPGSLAAAVGAHVPVQTISEPRAAVRAAVADARSDEAVLVSGSLFLVGEAYAALTSPGMPCRLFQPWQAPGSDGTEAAS